MKSLSEFPSHSDLRGLFPDHQVDESTYNLARHLFETRPRRIASEGVSISVNYHIRECLQLAICQRKTGNGFATSQAINYATSN